MTMTFTLQSCPANLSNSVCQQIVEQILSTVAQVFTAAYARSHILPCQCRPIFEYHHVYGSLWRWKYWSVRQIKPALLAFGRTL